MIIGGGIVGLSTGISLLEKQAHLRVSILERTTYLLGASTKMHGLPAGSPSELLEDLKSPVRIRYLLCFNRRFQHIQNSSNELVRLLSISNRLGDTN